LSQPLPELAILSPLDQIVELGILRTFTHPLRVHDSDDDQPAKQKWPISISVICSWPNYRSHTCQKNTLGVGTLGLEHSA